MDREDLNKILKELGARMRRDLSIDGVTTRMIELLRRLKGSEDERATPRRREDSVPPPPPPA